MSLDDAVRYMRSRQKYRGLVDNAYLGRDVAESARRFAASGEFAEVRRLLGGVLPGATVVDVGAGTAIAAHAFLGAGARRVLAIEPDPSDEVGQGAIRRLPGGHAVEIVSAYAERLPLADASADVVYARQVLHHTRDLPAALRECARLLRPGGVFVACREHVVDNEAQLATFLSRHAVHQLAGGEHAYSLDAYVSAITGAGLALEHVFARWDSVINAYPLVRTQQELPDFPRAALRNRLGRVGVALGRVPGVAGVVRRVLSRPSPGRMYSFVARKPA